MQKHKNRQPQHVSAKIYAEEAIKLSNNGETKKALELAELANKLEPKNDHFLHILGVLFKMENKIDQSIIYFEKAISINNRNPLYYYNLGLVYKEAKNMSGSLTAHKSALELANNNLLCLNEVALLYMEMKEYGSAMESLQCAYLTDRNDLATCINLSHLHFLVKSIPECIKYATEAMTIDPERPEPYLTLGRANIVTSVHEVGIKYLKESIKKGVKDSIAVRQSILMHMLYPDCYTPEEIFFEHQQWAKNLEIINRRLTFPASTEKNRPLNIAFISADFKEHSISYFLIPLLECIDKNNFRIYCYSAVEHEDDVTEAFKQLSSFWRNMTKKNEEEIVSSIIDDKIDILIDLGGHSSGSNIPIFNHKPAPIQLSYLGYPFSTGLKTIDYRITDGYCDPDGTTEHLYTETLIRLTPTFLCYKPSRQAEISETLPFERNAMITFGSFNNFAKLSGQTLETWAKVLQSVKNSRLILKSSTPSSDLLNENIYHKFKEHNIDQKRVELHNMMLDKNEHMSFYNSIDICFDPFPYNGTTTTFEAIYMGVPVISLRGKTHYDRVGYSILSNLGLKNLVAESKENYVEIACKLATNKNLIKQYRFSLRGILLSSPLSDKVTYSKKFEQALRKAWHTYCEIS